MTILQSIAMSTWTFTEYGPGNHQKRTLNLPNREFIVGRTSEAGLCVPETSVSKRHARVAYEQGAMIVEDLNSTNGTYLNCKKVQTCVAKPGDLIQFGNSLFLVGVETRDDSSSTQEQGILPWAQTLLHFDKLLNERAIHPHYQPIVTMRQRETIAYEMLVRSKFEGLSSPAAIFQAAERLGQNATLSELCREVGIQAAAASKQSGLEYFVNTHPCEVVNDRLIASLQSLRSQFPAMRITLEIHEASVTDPKSMSELRSVLKDLSIGLSYDDFGAGQGRLMELGEQPPDVLKFDMQLIRDIDKAPASKQEMLATLVKLSADLGTTPLAEGVETIEEHEVCLAMGFELGQGYLYGKPLPF